MQAGPTATMRLTPVRESVATARALATQFLAEAGWPDDAHHDVALVVSELVTNAIVHGAPPIDLHLHVTDNGPTPRGRARDLRSVHIEVSDASPLLPVAHAADREQIDTTAPIPVGGWGLRIVDRVSHHWGVLLHTNGQPGKIVWADVEPTELAELP